MAKAPVYSYVFFGYTDTFCPNGQTQPTMTNEKLLLPQARLRQPLLKINVFRCNKDQCLITT